MTAETIFSSVNLAVLPAWLLLVFAPRRRWTRVWVHSAIAPALLIALYACTLVMMYATQSPGSGFAEVQRMLSSPWGLVTVWVHAVVFDLFIGAWQVRDAARVDIPHWVVVPCLALTLFYGPIGLGCYLLIRCIKQRSASVQEERASA